MTKRVFIETTIPSYLAAWPARDLLQAARQQITHDSVDILLTWNCRHIANAAIIRELSEVVTAHGFRIPILCTPEELLEELPEESSQCL